MAQQPLHPLVTDMLIESGWTKPNQANATYALNGFLRWLAARHDGAGVALADVTRVECHDYLEHRRALGLSPNTVYGDWRYLKALFRWLATEGELSGERRSPMAKIPQPRIPTNPRTPVATDAAYDTLMASIPRGTSLGRRNAAMISLMYRSGCRVGELGPIDLAHYDVDAALITVPVTKTLAVRRVPVHPETATLIGRYLRSRGREPGPLFRAEGRSLSPRLRTAAVQSAVKAAVVRAGVDISPHMLRRAFAVNWMRAGGSVTGLQVVGGWEDQRMPLRYQGERREEVAAEEFMRLAGATAAPRRRRGAA